MSFFLWMWDILPSECLDFMGFLEKKLCYLLYLFIVQNELWHALSSFLFGWVFVLLWQNLLFEASQNCEVTVYTAQWFLRLFKRKFYCLDSPYAPGCKNQKMLDLKRHRKMFVGKKLSKLFLYLFIIFNDGMTFKIKQHSGPQPNKTPTNFFFI